MKVRFFKKDGVIIEGKDRLRELFNSAPDGENIVSLYRLSTPQTIEEWRKLYFHLRDELHEATDTGYTKKELHEVIKVDIIPKMIVDEEGDEWFQGHPPEPSTKYLTVNGWEEYIKRYKQSAMDEFNIFL